MMFLMLVSLQSFDKPIAHLVTLLVMHPLPLKLSFDEFQQSAIYDLCLTICLWMAKWQVMVLYT